MMTAELMYAIATLMTWVGIGLLVRGVFLLFKRFFGTPGFDPDAVQKKAAISTGVGAALLLLSTVFPKQLGHEVGPGIKVPIFWPYATLPGWMILFGLFFIVANGIQYRTALTKEEAKLKLRNMAIWAGVGVVGFIWMKRAEQSIHFLRGAIPMQLTTILAIVALLVVTLFVMVRTEKATRTKGIAKTVSVQLALLAGTIVFGIPFAWMLSTSFKEEIDFANTDGLVWIPKVQLTHEYMDEEKPLVSVRFEGRKVQAGIDSNLGDGKYLLEIERPYGLRGRRFEANESDFQRIARQQLIYSTEEQGQQVTAFVVQEQEGGSRLLEVLTPAALKGDRIERTPEEVKPVRETGLRWQNYSEAIEWMPFETYYGLRYLTNTLWLVVMSVLGTVLSCSVVAYGFSRLRFPGRDQLFNVMLATMALPAAVTILPQFLIFRSLGWIDTLLPLWVPTFFAGAFNVFLLRQFFSTVPLELEEAARIDGCGYWKTFWAVMLPMVKPALAAIAIWTFMGAWNNFMGPLIYVNTPEKMPVAYALQIFSGDKGLEAGLMMAFSTMTIAPVVLLFFFAQRYFIEGVQLSGLGGR
ncbi:MAG: carbohydrate ABC transporter permease [Armatimonadetes bacterium]|nr:carbohydrate ABC transporter permease [Armatimonadota bacterium]